MRRYAMPFALSAMLVAGTAFAADFGTADEAKAMLDSTVTAMKADTAGTIAKINAGEIKDRDLYPYCGGPDGMVSAHPSEKVRAMSLKELKDKTGKPFGEEIYANAKEGAVSEVAYMWPRPGETEPVEKIAYITKIGDNICGVGYYK
ncbi:MAG: cache domain-containing protein [Rhodospirillales bacterium]|nr:cache domain-containing protein [Rhodospirillales bacterium]